jgi:serine phosphatase RsbU (regulator of sigma subunit)
MRRAPVRSLIGVTVMARRVHRLGLVLSRVHAVQSNPPPGILWEFGGFQMLAESRTADGLPGGDFYTFALRAPTRLAVVIGDACGRGRDGAELVPLVLPAVDALLPTEASPGRLLSEVNRILRGNVAKDRFITAAAFELDASAGSIVAACAGHVPTLIRNAEGRVRAVARASGPPLGIENECEYTDEQHDLTLGDVVVFMTDGLLEALETDLMAMETLRRILASAPAGNGAVHRFLLSELDRCTLRRRSDDVLLLSLEVVSDLDSPRAPVQGGGT